MLPAAVNAHQNANGLNLLDEDVFSGTDDDTERPLPWCMPSVLPVEEWEFKSSFDSMDTAGQGEIPIADIRECILRCQTEGGVGDPRVSKMLRQLDDAGNGMVTWTEFQTHLAKMHLNRSITISEMIYTTLEDPGCSKAAKWISWGMLVLILISSVCFIVESLPVFRHSVDGKEPTPNNAFFANMEVIAILLFTVEYVARLLTCHSMRDLTKPVDSSDDDILTTLEDEEDFRSIKKSSGWAKTMVFVVSPMNIIDLVAIVPFYLEVALGSGGGPLAVLRILRLARVFRMFKLGKYNSGLLLFARTMVNSKAALILLIFFFILVAIVFGALLFFTESGSWHDPAAHCTATGDGSIDCKTANLTTLMDAGFKGEYLRPDYLGTGSEESPFKSILHSAWCVVATATSVGYGDLYPTTAAGKVIGTIAMLLGLLVLALPISVIGTNFSNEYDKQRLKDIEVRVVQEERKAARLYKENHPSARKMGRRAVDARAALEKLKAGTNGGALDNAFQAQMDKFQTEIDSIEYSIVKFSETQQDMMSKLTKLQHVFAEDSKLTI